MVLTADGGVAVVGSTNSEGGGSNDILLVKLDMEGNQEWVRIIGTADNEQGVKIIALQHSPGYVVCGTTTFSTPYYDILIIKTDEMGRVEWSGLGR